MGIDPVCNMTVKVDESSEKTEYKGSEYYFCGKGCRERFEKAPERYISKGEGRTVWLRVWKYEVMGAGGYIVPVYFLDADLPENSDWDRTITHSLYGGDLYYRLSQEIVLGIGGVRMLRALGYGDIGRFHMNEGHAALLTLELLDEEADRAGRPSFNVEDMDAVRARCVFTTHTPVPAGHDQFPVELMYRVLGYREDVDSMKDVFCVDCMEVVGREVEHLRDFSDVKDIFSRGRIFNMTYLALNLSRYVNGVAKRHGEVSRLMFAGYNIDAITNGVHAATWVSRPFEALYNHHIPGWKKDNFSLRYALNIPKNEVWQAHMAAKETLIRRVNEETNAGMDVDVFTIGFARRATAYKRADLIFDNMERLRSIAADIGPLQIVFAGKAHPEDMEGKEIIKHLFVIKDSLRDTVKVAYLDNYGLELGKLMTSGVDLWLNTPKPPLEASGTSGMKAALNGVPSLSILDGWWLEGCIEGVTGWSIGKKVDNREGDNRSKDATSLYDKLESLIIPMFYSPHGLRPFVPFDAASWIWWMPSRREHLAMTSRALPLRPSSGASLSRNRSLRAPPTPFTGNQNFAYPIYTRTRTISGILLLFLRSIFAAVPRNV